MKSSITISAIDSSEKDGTEVLFKMRDGKIKLNIGSADFYEVSLGFDCDDVKECFILTTDQVKTTLLLPIHSALYSIVTLKFKVTNGVVSAEPVVVFSRGSEFEHLSRLRVHMTHDYTYVPH